LWACTDVLQMLPTGKKIEFYIDSEYLWEGVRDRSVRRRFDVLGPAAAVLDTAWKAFDQAAARHSGNVNWISYDPLSVLTFYKVIQTVEAESAMK